ncbi:TonB-dependent receptor [Flavicella sp.]|uniref:TonB-dependent receptor n=1 Tax=Flavicella sp. TaxID=2957742 RepID=UPI00301B3EBC
MRNSQIVSCVVMFLFLFQTNAQTIKIKGIVKDSIGNGLEMANVIAINSATEEMAEYAITDSKGRYQLSLSANQVYELKVSYMGFNTASITIDLINIHDDLNQDITLKETNDLLDVVEISYEMPVTIKGDTIVYNADSFRNGTERKLGDVLEKLPGVEINDDGEIEIEGKVVTKVMVEGKDFFDGDSKIAIENIPADALDKIEVLRNYSEVGQMKGVTNNEDSIAINIRLKTGKDKFWFGEVTAGAGVENLYLVQPKIFYYSPKTSINVLTDFNNIGSVPFSNRDYYRFTGGLRSLSSRGGTSLNISDNTVGLSTTQNNRAYELSSQFGAANFSHNPNEKTTFSGFGIYSGTQTDMLESTIKNYEDTGDIEKIESGIRQDNKLGLLKLSTVYKPTTDFQLDYDIFFKKSEQEENSLQESELNSSDNGLISTDNSDDPFSFTQNLNIYKTFDSKNIMAVEAQYLYQQEFPVFNSLSEVLNVDSFLTPTLNTSQEYYDLTQDKTIKTSRFDGKVDYYFLLNDQSNLNVTVGTLLSKQKFNSGLFQTLDNGSEDVFEGDGYNNDVEFYFSDVYTALHYKFVRNKLTVEPGLKLHYYATKDTQLGNDNTTSQVRLLPDFYARYQFKKTESLRFSYTMTNQFTDIKQLSEGLLFNNYNNVYEGNRDLESAIYHNYSLSFFSFVMYNYTNINASINYTKQENTIKGNTEFDGIGQSGTSINSLFADETVSARFRYGRTFRKLKVNLRTSGNYSKNNNVRNGEWFVNDVLSYSYGGDIGTNFNKIPNITVGYTKSTNNYGDRIYHTDRPFVNIDAKFLKHFILTSDYDYYNYYDEANTISNKYAFLSSELSFRIDDSHWEYVISGTNLLNTKSLNRDAISVAANTVTSSSYFVQPRYIMFILKYNL